MMFSMAVVASGLCATTGSSVAQVEPGSSEVHVYAGYLFGGEITDGAVAGHLPSLDDDVVMGLRYTYNATAAWGVEVSAGYSPNQVTDLEGEDVGLDLLTVDVDAVWRFRPQSRLVPYVTLGVGLSRAELDHLIRGASDGGDVTIGDETSFTANVGAGLVYHVTEHFLVRADARYRYFNELLDRCADSLNSPEATIGAGWRF